jgi:hypothetical protein
MTLTPGLRVHRTSRPNVHGTTQDYPRALPHRTLIAWDDTPGLVQFVDDDLLALTDAEQEALPL